MPGTATSGRRPTATAVLKRRGSKVAKNRTEPGLIPVLKVEPSADYSPKEREIFLFHADVLIRQQVLSTGDLACLDVFTRIYAKILTLEAFIKTNGDSYKSGDLNKTRPEVTILSDLRKDLKGYISLLGLSPATRSTAQEIKLPRKMIEDGFRMSEHGSLIVT